MFPPGPYQFVFASGAYVAPLAMYAALLSRVAHTRVARTSRPLRCMRLFLRNRNGCRNVTDVEWRDAPAEALLRRKPSSFLCPAPATCEMDELADGRTDGMPGFVARALAARGFYHQERTAGRKGLRYNPRPGGPKDFSPPREPWGPFCAAGAEAVSVSAFGQAGAEAVSVSAFGEA